MTATGHPNARAERARRRSADASGIARQHRDEPRRHVRRVDAGVRADEPVVRFGDQDAAIHPDDPARLAEDHLDDPGVLAVRARPLRSPAATATTSSSRTMAPSAFDTIFCATTKTSPASTRRPSRARPRRRSAPPRSAPRVDLGNAANGEDVEYRHGCRTTNPFVWTLSGAIFTIDAHFARLAERVAVLARGISSPSCRCARRRPSRSSRRRAPGCRDSDTGSRDRRSTRRRAVRARGSSFSRALLPYSR